MYKVRCKIFNKNLKAYFTVEAAFLMPVILCIYLIIIMAAIFLYDRSVISQDDYLLAFRGSRFTKTGDNMGEVIYADMKSGEFDREYIKIRLYNKSKSYPFYQPEIENTGTYGGCIFIVTQGFHNTLLMKKQAEQINPFEQIRKVRRSL